jgi:hypothetical protein
MTLAASFSKYLGNLVTPIQSALIRPNYGRPHAGNTLANATANVAERAQRHWVTIDRLAGMAFEVGDKKVAGTKVAGEVYVRIKPRVFQRKYARCPLIDEHLVNELE